MSSSPSVHRALQALQAQGLPRLESQMLVLHALGLPSTDRAWLLTHDTHPLDAGQFERLEHLAEQRQSGVPMAYLIGRKRFHAIDLHIDPRVLDPRDDTETLVDWALEIGPADASLAVLDLGTGSGAIALALAQARPQWQVSATDLNPDALAVARANGQRLGLRVQWMQGNWLAAVPGQTFDLIVSNPPYIAQGDPHLPALSHEPRQALVSGPDGLEAIRQICAQAPLHLRPGGCLLLEHGHDQARDVRTLLSQTGFSGVQSRCDLAGIERCSGGFWSPAKKDDA